MFIGGFCAGMIIGLIFGPDSEREDVARVDGWLDGYRYAKRDGGNS